ncbi:cyclic beta 1-2 glucan synthetase [Paraglaciecola agarilytica]|uniref:GH36-type glycosyl hydrolase domain-containing protein n=1 Tax=Paraglaciecola chathamensis TaxID=368405 RepID=UPI001C08C556|nr:glucoamylase family protein [Paraglaciecola agarilytica]MBU3018766.1 cyclic beta 1-2 glucan synthetase [Paraglaciecola agarilytica]
MNLLNLLSGVSRHFFWFSAKELIEQTPLRAELLSTEQMGRHAISLAKTHILNPINSQDKLLERLADNEQVLIDTNRLLSCAVKAKKRIAPSGEWLLDNFYLIEEQIRTARHHFPKGYSRELPRLAQGASSGLPRVYDIALNVISHGDGRVDTETLSHFVEAYQSVTPLTLGELWAIPIMLRLALIENLRRVSARITMARQYLNLAEKWANQMLETAEQDPKSLILIIADMARSAPPMESAFVAELTRQLQGHGPALALPLTWIEQQLAESSLTIEQLVQSENQQQAADQVSINNTIASLRWLTAMDWCDFVEANSYVEKILRQDKGGLYGAMDFVTRDRYRHAIDRLAKRSPLSEIEIAKVALRLAQQAVVENGNSLNENVVTADPHTHVGYYLIDQGAKELERKVDARVSYLGRLRSVAKRMPLFLYLGAILLLTLTVAAGLLSIAQPQEIEFWRFFLLTLLSLLGASQLALALVHWIATLLIEPQRLPRMDFSKGLPDTLQTLVVIPTMLSSSKGIDSLLEILEVRYLGNIDTHLRFALLTDFHDAERQIMPEDDNLVQQISVGIERLNAKYPEPLEQQQGSSEYVEPNSKFFLLHRPRSWNKQEQLWMGSERKRGKLGDLNALLRGQQPTHFSETVGNISTLGHVKYVITLDTDTQMPRDCARQLVGAMAHPLNQPRIDHKKQCVIAGYGILQPRMAASLSGQNISRYVQLCGEEPGIDPYTRTVSNVYQDVFAEGSYIGKGIYDIDAFEQTLNSRLPENQILSHDLLEGCYARSGLLSDLHFYEEYPGRYDVDMARRERWIRGDWQIAQWLLPWVPNVAGKRCRNPLPSLSRWKIFDNLRRSVTPFALFMLFSMGWWSVSSPSIWTFALLGMYMLPLTLNGLLSACRKPSEMLLYHHLHSVAKDVTRQMAQMGFQLATLPYEAVFNLTAIIRSLCRMIITRRGLLEWQITDHKSDNRALDIIGSYRTMWSAPILAITMAGSLLWLQSASFTSLDLMTSLPILLLWFLSPMVVWWLSKPQEEPEPKLSMTQIDFLHRIARKTWAYFDHFSCSNDNWLIPDNFQETPGPLTAHRTSPTNIGLSLLGNVTAYDFGYIPASDLLLRTHNCFSSLSKLERHHGHFYNWYDTQTLLPLPPRYISSVDSGNLAGHLLTLRIALLELPKKSIVSSRLLEGLETTLSLVAAYATDVQDTPIDEPVVDEITKSSTSSHTTFLAAIQSIRVLLSSTKNQTLSQVFYTLQQLVPLTQSMQIIVDKSVEHPQKAKCKRWLDDLIKQSNLALEDIGTLTPWVDLSPAPTGLTSLLKLLDAPISSTNFQALETLCTTALTAIETRFKSALSKDEEQWLLSLREKIEASGESVRARKFQGQKLAGQAFEFAAMDYQFLYDNTRHMLAIGYNVDDNRRDASFYDLLASEARLCTFIAIAQGQIPQESWFALSRLLTTAGGEPVLVSWSGSMFEYLMPMLVMPSYKGTLLDQTMRAAVTRQIAYGNLRNVPWGVSESAYNTVDANQSYQYHAFGVPGLGLKRGLAEDLVIAPYATVLALMVAPEAACENLYRLTQNGLEGHYGFYEAIDYSTARLTRGRTSEIMHSFMAHHQGMSLLALAYRLLDRPMQKRFESDPLFQSTLLLLQERVPKTSVFQPHVDQNAETGTIFDHAEESVNIPISAETPSPEVQLLSNGRYHVMMTNAGGGYSRWRDLSVTRWREDPTCDNWGTFVYIRDTTSGDFWSATHQPTLKKAQSYSAFFSEGRAEFRRTDQNIETYSEIVVSPEDDIELRRIRLTNHSGQLCKLDITTYAEVVMALPATDLTHPSFSNLFVQTEILEGENAILCSRRPRSDNEKTSWMFHLLVAHKNGGKAIIGQFSSTTDRMQFIGRGRTLVSPKAMVESSELLAKSGSVLDPVVAIRCPVTLDTRNMVTLELITGMADSRAACLSLINKYKDRHMTDRVLDLAWTHSGVTLRQINASETDTHLYRRLASSILYANPTMRAEEAILVQNQRSQSGLWGYSISGDLPIVLLKIASSRHIELARQMIQCHAYWRLKGLVTDLIIWNEEQVGYRQNLQEQIIGLIATGTEAHYIDRPGGIFVRSTEQISSEDRILLKSVSRAILVDTRGTLDEQVNRRTLGEKRVAPLTPTRTFRLKTAMEPGKPRRDLLLGNGLGGFSNDGREYIITTTLANQTPLPWVNVLANAQFGTVIAESGLSYTWSENAHEYRLTPWSEDSVGSTGGEAFYIRDEDSGYYWSPSPMPSRGATPYVTRHGFGYSIFEHTEGGIHSELCVYVDTENAVKFSVLKIHNCSGRPRRLTATGYVEWVLGDLRSKTALHVLTEIDPSSGAIFARNAYNSEFTGRVAFFDVDDMSRSLTGDRCEFLGRNGTLRRPEALTRKKLSGRLGAALDPCGAIQVPFELENGQEHTVIFRLGAGKDIEKTRELARQLRQPGSARQALENVHQFWQDTLGVVQVDTPDPAVNIMCNGWLTYQTLACRFWARSGFYQSGGAFGFRDQLQDAMSLLHAKPDILREHLLLCASRQYPQGDVQHWWHPPAGRGVRTRCSDDYLWLPLAVCRYVKGTGDSAVLNQNVSFIEGRALNEDEESYYDMPTISHEQSSLYQHCVLAIKHGLRLGDKGLPLMGSGDWNDGMSLVGIHGKGESVWLGFFLYKVLQEFSVVASEYNDPDFSEHCLREAKNLAENLAKNAWDGAWYRRAWFDNGTPLGSKVNTECSIDSIAQSWSVLSGAGDQQRTQQAMASLDQYLVRKDSKLIQLLDPPFDKSAMNPGYIKGYVPGVRENGGQYTHAAIWATMAFAKQGNNKKAWELLTLINPLNHASNAIQVKTYKAEPYVVAADVYAVEPHVGRGGWTWYTGSASWMYRLMLESLLGLTREGDQLRLEPCIPAHWKTYSIDYWFNNTQFQINVHQTPADEVNTGVCLTLDGQELTPPCVPLVDDNRKHKIEFTMPIKVECQDRIE